jgi:hypothetical protein
MRKGFRENKRREWRQNMSYNFSTTRKLLKMTSNTVGKQMLQKLPNHSSPLLCCLARPCPRGYWVTASLSVKMIWLKIAPKELVSHLTEENRIHKTLTAWHISYYINMQKGVWNNIVGIIKFEKIPLLRRFLSIYTVFLEKNTHILKL